MLTSVFLAVLFLLSILAHPRQRNLQLCLAHFKSSCRFVVILAGEEFMLFDFLCGGGPPESKFALDIGQAYECDYDKNPIPLYQAIEDRAWVPVLDFLKKGTWEQGIFFTEVKDPLPPAQQARTWVTRTEKLNGKVRWSQLPLHAALIFGAPYQILEKLLQLYPEAARCTDDQHMLPLHMALKYDASDKIVIRLLSEFPQALMAKDLQGRTPSQIETANVRSTLMEIVATTITDSYEKEDAETHERIVKGLKGDLEQKSKTHESIVKGLQQDLEQKSKVNEILEQTKAELEKERKRALTEITILRGKMEEISLDNKHLKYEQQQNQLKLKNYHGKVEELRHQNQKLQTEHDQYMHKYKATSIEVEDLRLQKQRLEMEYQESMYKCKAAKIEVEELRVENQKMKLQKERDAKPSGRSRLFNPRRSRNHRNDASSKDSSPPGGGEEDSTANGSADAVRQPPDNDTYTDECDYDNSIVDGSRRRVDRHRNNNELSSRVVILDKNGEETDWKSKVYNLVSKFDQTTAMIMDSDQRRHGRKANFE